MQAGHWLVHTSSMDHCCIFTLSASMRAHLIPSESQSYRSFPPGELYIPFGTTSFFTSTSRCSVVLVCLRTENIPWGLGLPYSRLPKGKGMRSGYNVFCKLKCPLRGFFRSDLRNVGMQEPEFNPTGAID